MENRTFTCKNCNVTSDTIGIEQKEINYYIFDLECNQMEDYDEGECESQTLFCLNCNIKVNDNEFEL